MDARGAGARRGVTLTLNPAVDVSTRAAAVVPTHKVRCGPAQFHPGGGGINVARVVHRLGGEVTAMFLAGGPAGDLLCRLLDREAVPRERIPIAQETRESFSVHDDGSGLDWRFVLPGPTVSAGEWQDCLSRAGLACRGSAFLGASGSLPPGVPDDFYGRLAHEATAAGVPLVLDTSGPALAAGLRAGVHLIKPSLRELQDVSGGPLATLQDRVDACRALIARKAAAVVALSLGAEGALLVTADGAWQAPALQVPVLSTIGAGDSFVGGLVASLAKGLAIDEAFRTAMAASAAALLAPGTVLCRPEDSQRLRPQVQVRAVA